MRVLLVDDHLLIREGFKGLLNTHFTVSHVDEAADGDTVLNLLKHNQYDLMMLDITLDESNGIEVLETMKNLDLFAPTLVVSFYPPSLYAMHVIRLGAMGYISKGANENEYVEAISKVISGKKYLPADFMESLAFQNNAHRGLLPHERLSDREMQVMVHLSSGVTIGEIAERLCLSEKTVSTYRSRILQKMDMKNNVELATYAILHKLVQ